MRRGGACPANTMSGMGNSTGSQLPSVTTTHRLAIRVATAAAMITIRLIISVAIAVAVAVATTIAVAFAVARYSRNPRFLSITTAITVSIAVSVDAPCAAKKGVITAPR